MLSFFHLNVPANSRFLLNLLKLHTLECLVHLILLATLRKRTGPSTQSENVWLLNNNKNHFLLSLSLTRQKFTTFLVKSFLPIFCLETYPREFKVSKRSRNCQTCPTPPFSTPRSLNINAHSLNQVHYFQSSHQPPIKSSLESLFFLIASISNEIHSSFNYNMVQID